MESALIIEGKRGKSYDKLSIKDEDKEVYAIIQEELNRQRNKLEMIASENIVSYAVMEAQGSVLTNKYAEGYPGKRYYGGCEYVDKLEQLESIVQESFLVPIM